MTFDATERSLADAAPVELYKFTGTFTTYRMTSHLADITNTEGTYTREAIKRNSTKVGDLQESNLALELELPYAHPMITEYVFATSPPTLTCEFYRCHLNDVNDTILMWSGSVLSWSIEGRNARLKIPNLLSYALEKPVPPVYYQGPCNHVLGDARCGIDMELAANKQSTTITTINGTSVTVGASTFAVNECAAGEMVVGQERRMIISNNGTAFTIASPFAVAAATDAVDLYRGCNHAFNGHCINRFNNAVNFGGFPLVPDRNPFKSRL